MKVDKVFTKKMDQKLLQLWQQCIEFKKVDLKFCQDQNDWSMVDFHKDSLKAMEEKFKKIKVTINGSR